MYSKRYLSILILVISFAMTDCAYLFKAPRPKTLKERALEQIWYISTPEQREELKKLNTPQEINQFMENFWKKLGTIAGTDENMLRRELEKRYEFVSINYPNRRGCGMSDQGRVYMLYGPPDQIDKNPFCDIELANYKWIKGIEIWIYDRPATNFELPNIFSNIYPNQMKFIFADLKGLGIYTQIYSSVQGELIDSRIFLVEY